MMLYLILILFVSFPLLMVAIGLKYLWLALVALGVGALYLGLFLLNGFSEFLHEYKAVEVDESQEERLQKLWKESGRERVQARFWIYPSSEARFNIWIKNEKNIEIFLSLGLYQLATDAGLRAAFQSMSTLSFSEVRAQNRRHALMTRFQRLKGPSTDFRYWFLSFWLYPLERLLKIAKL